jgi:hypothetical protein
MPFMPFARTFFRQALLNVRLGVFTTAFAAGAAWSEIDPSIVQTHVHEGDENFVCGISEAELAGLNHLDAPAGALGKQAVLPKVNKVWTGNLRALVVRISFADVPFAIDTATINRTHTTINTLYRAMSRNTFEWNFRIYEQILVTPSNRSRYDSSFNTLQSWINTQLTATGLRRGTDYDVFIAVFPRINVGWAGLSNLSYGNWINGSYGAGVTAHELGHSLALPHAHSIEGGADIFGTPGTSSQSVEYGNPFDVMGRGASTGHFSMPFKWHVGWLDSAEVKDVTAPGVYRIYAHDNALHKGRTIGLRLPSTNTAYSYWLEYRPTTTNSRNGLIVNFQGFLQKKLDIWFLDTTPGSRTSSDENDGVLALNKDLADKFGNAIIKPLAVNTGVWSEEGWIDVEITIPGVTSLAMPTSREKLQRKGGPGLQFMNPVSALGFDARGRLLAR